jgi:hypothetical protein
MVLLEVKRGEMHHGEAMRQRRAIEFWFCSSLLLLPLVADAEETVKDGTKCTALYSDEEAVALTSAAIESVPPGRLLSRVVVLKRLGLDPQRLCNRRVHPYNMSYFERWQISKTFDLTWAVPAGNPGILEMEDRKIFYVRILNSSELFPPREDATKAWRRVHGKAAKRQSQ